MQILNPLRTIIQPYIHGTGLTAFLLAAVAFLPSLSKSQNATFVRMDSLQVVENSTTLRNPATGGLNLPQFSAIDLNGDNIQDLVVFDRAGNKLLTYLNGGTAGQVDYTYAPQYESAFPTDLKNFVLLADFDCDDKADIFTSTREIGVKVYRNTSTGGNLSFSSAYDTLFTDLGAGPSVLLVSPKDIPAFVDVDGDGDLDALTFDTGGSFVEWHKNMAVENSSACDHLEFVLADACWGKFQESALNQSVTLNISCRVGPQEPFSGGNPFDGRHAGSTISAYDGENDGDLEVLLGDLIFDGITYLHNGGTASSALMDSMDVNFPAEDVQVRLNIFPASFVLDVNNDNKKDILVSPNAENIAVNYDNVWWYQNVDPGSGITPTHQTNRLLVDQSIDVGSSSAPVLFDYNLDGKLDLIVGNYSFKTSSSNLKSGLALYENIGTLTQPRFELITRDFAGINNSFNPDIFGMVPTFGDLDGDGDSDMLIGDSDGKIHLFANVAASGQPADFVLSQANYFGIDVGGYAFPVLVDWNRDSKLDIVAGEWRGNMKYYENTGSSTSPVFSNTPTIAALGGVDVEPVCCTGNAAPHIFPNPNSGKWDVLVGAENGSIHYYPEAEISGTTFSQATVQFGQVFEGKMSTVTSGDLNNDGKRDWVVGNLRGGLSFYEGDIVIGQADAELEKPYHFSVFPNPSKGNLQVRLDSNEPQKMGLEITNLLGQTIMKMEDLRSNEAHAIDASRLQSGVYLIRVTVKGQPAETRKWALTR